MAKNKALKNEVSTETTTEIETTEPSFDSTQNVSAEKGQDFNTEIKTQTKMENVISTQIERKVKVYVGAETTNTDGIVQMPVSELVKRIKEGKHGAGAKNMVVVVEQDSNVPYKDDKTPGEPIETCAKFYSLNTFIDMIKGGFNVSFENEEGKAESVYSLRTPQDCFLMAKLIKPQHVSQKHGHKYPGNDVPATRNKRVLKDLDLIKKFSIGSSKFTIDDVLYFPNINIGTEAELLEQAADYVKAQLQLI